jgi:hypothetical protein
VSFRFADFKQSWIEQLLKATATPAVRGDILGILASAESLIGSSSSKPA